MKSGAIVCAVLAVVTSGVCAGAEGVRVASARVDAAVEAQRKAQRIPGVSLAVCRDGKVVKASG
jgi:CubicO group peptidase (beta-lactamase class C family)